MKQPLNTRTASMSTAEKALQFNLDPLHYGTIAEIGAGQEVARQFFQAGGASGTIAKTTSAYDMRFSDAIYGPDSTGRYVTRERLQRMLEREFRLVLERVADTRDPNSRFFAFADTVSAKQYGVDSEDHGWMGIRFQHESGAEPSQIVLHVRMLDSSNAGQQAALGILGVNLIHSTFKYFDNRYELVDSLVENLTWGRVEIDYIQLEGPGFEQVDNQDMTLRLVRSSLGPAVMFDQTGAGALPADMMYKKIPLILRGKFRPFTNVHADMIDCGITGLANELGVGADDIVLLCEMNIARYLYEGDDEISDLQARLQMIAALGYNAMVTSHLRYFRLADYFLKHRQRSIAFIVSVNNLHTVFNDKYYEGLDGGMLQAIAQLFACDAKLLAYPNLSPEGHVYNVDNIAVPHQHKYLYQHLLHNRRILPLEPDPDTLVPFEPELIGAQIAQGDRRWWSAVPELVRDRIEELTL
ncbi:MAG: TonB-dependent receptor [Gemmatimonadota bacterium]|nr:MAG: TonB-dependent receptor [Gemmatimonadota bacterium]